MIGGSRSIRAARAYSLTGAEVDPHRARSELPPGGVRRPDAAGPPARGVAGPDAPRLPAPATGGDGGRRTTDRPAAARRSRAEGPIPGPHAGGDARFDLRRRRGTEAAAGSALVTAASAPLRASASDEARSEGEAARPPCRGIDPGGTDAAPRVPAVRRTPPPRPPRGPGRAPAQASAQSGAAAIVKSSMAPSTLSPQAAPRLRPQVVPGAVVPDALVETVSPSTVNLKLSMRSS